jgi:hypothetical protein
VVEQHDTEHIFERQGVCCVEGMLHVIKVAENERSLVGFRALVGATPGDWAN